MRNLLSTFLLAVMTGAVVAQSPSASRFDQHKAFDPIFYPSGSTVYRSAGGAPGEKYWTNRVDYAIHTPLDTTAHALSGGVTVRCGHTPLVLLPGVVIRHPLSRQLRSRSSDV